LSANQFGHQCRQAIVFAFDPMVFDRYVLAFNVAGFAQSFEIRLQLAKPL
jgi:hypothetical protein